MSSGDDWPTKPESVKACRHPPVGASSGVSQTNRVLKDQTPHGRGSIETRHGHETEAQSLRHPISLIVVRAESAYFVVRLGLVLKPTVTIDQDDIPSEGLGAIVSDMDVVCASSVDGPVAESRISRCRGQHRLQR